MTVLSCTADSTIYQHSVSNNHSRANTSHLKITDQDSKKLPEKPFISESTALPSTTTHEKCSSWKSSTTFLEQMDPQTSLTIWYSDHQQGHTHHTVPSNRFSRAVCLANSEASHPVTNCQVMGPSTSRFILGTKEVLHTSQDLSIRM